MQESDEMAPASGSDPQLASKFSKVPSASSIDSQDIQEYSESPSDDLDKLSLCLSEVSSEVGDSKKSSLLSDIIQAQLAFWTLIISIFYTYAWQQHRKKFLFSLIMVVPPVILICGTLSSLLTAIVIMGRLFSTPLRFDDVLKYGGGSDEDDEHISGATSASRSMMNLAGASGLPVPGSLVGGAFNRRRTLSGNSNSNIFGSVQNSSATVPPIRRFERSGGGLSTSTFGLSGRSVSGGGGGLRSSSCEDLALPKPVCRKHSSQQFFNGCGGASGSGMGSRLFNYHHSGYSHGAPTNGGLVPTINGNSAAATVVGDGTAATPTEAKSSPSTTQQKATSKTATPPTTTKAEKAPLLKNGAARSSPPWRTTSNTTPSPPTKTTASGGKKTAIPAPHHHNQNLSRLATSPAKTTASSAGGGGGNRKLAVGKRRTQAGGDHPHPNQPETSDPDAPSTAPPGVGPKPFE